MLKSNKVVKNFEAQFHKDIMELLVLPKSSVGGASVLGDGYLLPSVTFIASVDLATGQLSHIKGRLEWLVKDNKKINRFGYEFEKLEIYRVKVRRCIEKELAPNMLAEMNQRYMLLEIIESRATHRELEEIAQEYAKPVLIQDARLGEFKLNREYDWFEGEVDWLGESCLVMLSVDEDGSDSGEQSFGVLKELCGNIEEWDYKLRSYAAETLTELANEWQEEAEDGSTEPITEAEFAKRITMSEISILQDGDMEIYFHDDDMFWGHVIIVSGNISGEMEDANIAG